MSNLAWRFPKLDGGEEQGINDGGIATFKGAELYNNLAREICQNSLDAKAPDKETVIVEFKSITLKKAEHPALMELDEIFKKCNDYWKLKLEPKLQAFLDQAHDKLDNDEIEFLVISDYNTKGLSGANAGIRDKSVWRALTHSSGVTQKEQGSGGSYGIGKNAPFACSDFRTIFYNTYALDDKIKAFQGVARLVSHFDNEEATQGVGFFQNIETKEPIFPKDACPLRDYFNRTEFGTDVIIAGFKKNDSWENEIEKAVINNFFFAIIKKKLVVKINGIEINDLTILERLKYYLEMGNEKEIKDKKISTTMEFYYAVTSPDEKIYGTIIEKDDVVLYIKKDDTYGKSIAEMRSIGMVVRTRQKNILTRYAAVMVVQENTRLNELLKEIEPPQHNKWDPELIENNPETIKKVGEFRKKLISWTNDTIIESCRSEIPDEIDLDGVSAYLPYDEDDKSLGMEEIKDFSPDSRNKPGRISRIKPHMSKETFSAQRVSGYDDENYEPHNDVSGGKDQGHGGTADPKGIDTVKTPVPGDSSVNVPKILSQRITQMPLASSYRVALVLENDYPTVNISIKAIGDDGTKEQINIKELKFKNNKEIVNSTQVTLHNLKGNMMHELFLILEYSEKMLLELLVS